MHSPNNAVEEDFNLVEGWLTPDVPRWIAGAMAGLFAGLVALGLAMVMAAVSGMEFWFPAKLMATTVLGSSATELGPHMGPILLGVALFEVLCAFWGFVYAQFVRSNQLGALLAMGVVWGLFSWIFIWNLFMHSFQTIMVADVSPATVFPICMAYGVSLTAVAFFDRAMRGSR